MAFKRLVQLSGLALALVFLRTGAVAPSSPRMTTPTGTTSSHQSHLHDHALPTSTANAARPGAAPQQVRTGTSQLPLAVDGSVSPDAIPDALAYRHFIATTAIRDQASAMEVYRRALRLRNIGLDESDEREYIVAVRFLREDLNRIEQQRKELSAARVSGAALQQLKDQEATLFAAARDQIESRLSQRGRTRFADYIRTEVKRKIKIYGSGPR